jgi:hypothetical protein
MRTSSNWLDNRSFDGMLGLLDDNAVSDAAKDAVQALFDCYFIERSGNCGDWASPGFCDDQSL